MRKSRVSYLLQAKVQNMRNRTPTQTINVATTAPPDQTINDKTDPPSPKDQHTIKFVPKKYSSGEVNRTISESSFLPTMFITISSPVDGSVYRTAAWP